MIHLLDDFWLCAPAGSQYSTRMEARLPQDKLIELQSMLTVFINRRTCRLIEMQRLLGKLNFACKVIVPGRTFMRRLYDATRHVRKPYHHIQLTLVCRLDLLWWSHLLSGWNGRSFFLEADDTAAHHLLIETDASGAIGFGAVFGVEWFSGTWDTTQAGLCITFKELYPICVACATWGHRWSRKRICFHTDNEAVACVIRSGTSKCSNVMSLLRTLFFICARGNFMVSALHIPGTDNVLADSLSRQDLARTGGDVDSALHFYVTEAYAPATRRLYASGQAAYREFCVLHRYPHLPATERRLAEFIVYLADIKQLAPVSIKAYLAGVRSLHVEQGYGNPLVGTHLLQLVMDGIRRVHGLHPRHTRLPITLGQLTQIIQATMDNATMHPSDRIMLATAFSLMFFGFLRCNEIISLCRTDITFGVTPRHLEIHLRQSKTDRFSRGETIHVGCAAPSMATVCPVTLATQLSALSSSQWLFTFKSGKRLSREAVSHYLQQALVRAHVPNAHHYNTHSFRIGAATTAADVGMPDWMIKALGRWSSDAYQGYVRNPTSQLVSATQRMCQ